jgi:hypothetical protein
VTGMWYDVRKGKMPLPCLWCEWRMQDPVAECETGLEPLTCSFIQQIIYSVLGTVVMQRTAVAKTVPLL